MPIEGISDIVRIPRLGKIRLGIKVERPGKTPYPHPVDYFVCPPEVQKVFGEKPKALDIMFPTEDPSEFAQQWLRSYSLTMGLVCIGNGEQCRRKVDLATGAMASHETRDWEWKDSLSCDPLECPEFGAKRCRRVMNLQFLLPTVPGLGVWQIDTSSFHSIVNTNTIVKILKGMLGRCSMLPLTLVLGPQQVTPLGEKKKTVYTLQYKKDVLLADLARMALLPVSRVLCPEPDVEEAPPDLLPQEVLSGEAVPPFPFEEHDVEEGSSKPPKEETQGFPGTDEERIAEWQEIGRLRRLINVTTKQMCAFFLQEHGLVVTVKEVEAPTPPREVSIDTLRRLRRRLEQYRMKLDGEPAQDGGQPE